MGLLDRFFKKPPQWTYPKNEIQNVGKIDHDYNKAYPTKSRSNPGKTFEVNVFKLSCTCPNFKNSRGQYGGRDVRRVCPHILKTLRELGLEKSIPQVLRMVMRHGREYRRFRRFRGRGVDVVFGFSKDSSEIGVFAVAGDEEMLRTYDLDDQAWTDGPPPRHEDALLEAVRKTFEVQ